MKLRKLLFVLFWLLVWQLAAVLVHNQIMLVGPLEVLASLRRLVVTPAFWTSLGRSLLRILTGFAVGTLLGIGLGAAAAHCTFLRELLSPLVTVIKAIPVASFVILVMIWLGSAQLSAVISGLVVFPLLYLNTLSGIGAADAQLLEMAAVFRVPLGSRLRCIYLPTLRPFWRSGLSLAMGMAWKSGVAAEVIGQPSFTVGNSLYKAKVLLETGDLLAWTVVTILAAALCEQLLLLLLREPKGGADGDPD